MANREILDSNFIIYERYLPNPYPYPASQTLAQTLVLGNTSGANHIVMDAGQNVDVTSGEVFAGTLNVNVIEPLAPSISTDIGIVGSLVFPGPIEMRNNGAGGGIGLTIDSIPSAVAPNANVLGYDTLTHQITHQPIPIETNKYINGILTIQTEIQDAVFDNETYNVVNTGIDPGIVSIPLTAVGNKAVIPFFTRDGTDFPTNTISDNGTPIDSSYPAVPSSGRIKCITTDPYNPRVFVCCYGPAGQAGTMVYEFNIEQNTWNQFALVNGEVNCIIINGNYMYLGGAFSTTITQSGTANCRNIIEIEMSSVNPNALPED
jgi:hypothetical protein